MKEYHHLETLMKMMEDSKTDRASERNTIALLRKELREDRTEIVRKFDLKLDDVTQHIKEVDEKIDTFVKDQQEVNISLLRHNIVDVYENFRGSKRMPQEVYQSTLSLYDRYVLEGGNSYVKEIVEQMKTWEKY